MISKKAFWLCLAVCPPVLADENTGQRLWQDTRQMEQAQERKIWEADAAARQSGPAQADVPQDTGAALYGAVNRNDWPAVNKLLAEYERQPGHDQDIALLARAASARGAGNWKTAKRHYETLLQRQPDFTRGRLDLARLLYEGRLNREAAAQFDQVLRQPDLPESVKANIETFQNGLKERGSWRGSVQAGAVWSSNVNASGGGTWCVNRVADECLAEWQANSPERASGVKYEATAARRWQLAGHHGVFVRGISYGQVFRNQKKHGSHTANLSAGYQFENHKDTFSAAPVWEWNSSGGPTESRAYGVRAEWDRNVGRWGWNSEAEWKRLDYVEHYNGLDGHTFSLNNTLSYTPAHDVLLFGGLDWQRRRADNDTDAYRQVSLRAGAVKMFGSGFDVSATAVVRHRSHDAYNALLKNRRRDNEQIYMLNLGAERWQVAGMKPTLSLKHRRVNSNVGWLYGYRQNEIGLLLKKTF